MLRRNAEESLALLKNATVTPGHAFVQPRRAVFNEHQMKEWENSEAYHEYFGFIKAMNRAVRGKSLKHDCYISPITEGILKMIRSLDDLITNTPPIDQPQRFGNKAFKTWYEQVKQNGSKLLEDALPAEFHKCIIEIVDYLTESFGNSTRIDYGTGHEMSFCMFLYCLFKIGAFTEKDAVSVVIQVFNSYLELVRRLQKVYRMEPAGSHGVWSLDDYQFIPFIWGSSQFVSRPIIEPKMFVQEETIKKYSSEYMLISCIQYITQVKTGHFSEHSNQLWNISGVSTWSKVNEGLLKMYQGEVLGKFPVIQHVVFGSLLRFTPFVAPKLEKTGLSMSVPKLVVSDTKKEESEFKSPPSIS